MDDNYPYIDITKACQHARALRSAYIRKFFVNLFARKSVEKHDDTSIMALMQRPNA